MEARLPADLPPGDYLITARKCTNNSDVRGDSAILEYRLANEENKTNLLTLRSPCAGAINFQAGTRRGDKVKPGGLIAVVIVCPHEIVIKDMCATCGKNLRERDGIAGARNVATKASIPMVHHVPELVVSDKLAKTLGDQEKQHALSARKLVLLVDLDQTLIHTTNRPPKFPLPKERDDLITFRLENTLQYTKLRPYTREFLEEMSKLYEMHIITFGQRQYAHAIAKIIDPEQKLFSHRVLSRDESNSQQHKTSNLGALFPSGDELVAIIDDRADVWQFSDALIQVRPYLFFSGVGDINAPERWQRKGKEQGNERVRQYEEKAKPPEQMKENPVNTDESTEKNEKKEEGEKKDVGEKEEEEGEKKEEEEKEENEREKKEEEENKEEKKAERKEETKEETKDDTERAKKTGKENENNPNGIPPEKDNVLQHIEKVLRDVHSAFYAHYDETREVRDIKSFINQRRREVLKGCVIVLSGIVPLGQPVKDSEVYRNCLAFGGRVAEKFDKNTTTHVIAARWGTEKVIAAKKAGVPIVKFDWLWECMEKWEKADVTAFALSRSPSPSSNGGGGDSVSNSPARHRRPIAPVLEDETDEVADLANMETMSKMEIADMNHEVDEALSGEDDEEDDEDEEEREKEQDKEEKATTSQRNTLKRARLPPEARDDYEEEEEGREEEEEPVRKRPAGRAIVETSLSDEEMAEGDTNEDDEDGEGERDYGEGWEERNGHGETGEGGGEEEEEAEEPFDEDDDEFDDMAAELENELNRE